MGFPGVARDGRRRLAAGAVLGLLGVSGCALLPAEFNLSPLYRHRLDEQGNVLEMDVLWPFIHYETTPDGGSDFRVRPFYRRVEKPDVVPAARATDHQFLWPLGRVRRNRDETSARLFPLWSWQSREAADGVRESDWYFLFPFVWGGSGGKDGKEGYFGVFPFYLDAPQFLTYDRFTAVLWPLYLRTEKDERVSHIFLWPFVGFGSGPGEDAPRWHRVLPLYNYLTHPGQTTPSLADLVTSESQ